MYMFGESILYADNVSKGGYKRLLILSSQTVASIIQCCYKHEKLHVECRVHVFSFKISSHDMAELYITCDAYLLSHGRIKLPVWTYLLMSSHNMEKYT